MTQPAACPTSSAAPRPPARGRATAATSGRLGLLATLLLALPAPAQVVPTGSPAADILLSRAIAEHRVFLTCSILDAEAHARIRTAWEGDVATALRLLGDRKIDPAAIAAFDAAARPEALLPTPETPFVDLRALCDQHPDWASRYAAGRFVQLAPELGSLLP